jgi:DnaJ-class molecular chaperone
MIHFNQIANPPKPVYRPMCVACDGRGVVPSLSMKLVQRCEQCNGTGKEAKSAEAAQAFVATLP